MPCYDPPPPWEGAQRKNAEEAVRILCSTCKTLLTAGLLLPRELATWYLAHRRIDLQIATDTQRMKPDPVAAEAARRDIALLEAMEQK